MLASARVSALLYAAAAPLLTADKLQPSHALAGHADTWPTSAQSLSPMHDVS
jgi:hypothetical protein